MNIFLASAILRETWCIDIRTAISYGSILSILLNDRTGLKNENSQIKPYALSSDGIKRGDITEAEKNDVAVIPIVGPLMKYSEYSGDCDFIAGMETIGSWIKRADENTNIKGIILKIDSPGGTVAGTENLANIVKETKKPIIAFINGMMASAALWIGSAADEIIASLPNDEIGSIGVMISFADLKPMYEAQGIKFHTINADQSTEKNKIFTDALEGNYEGIKTELLNPIAETFIKKVKENRPKVKEEQLTGKMFFAKELKGTLIDEIGNFDYAVQRIHELHKPIIKTIKYE